jgi:hypothetical protein
MITINPPVTKPYAPSTQPIAAVKVALYCDPNIPLCRMQIGLLTASGAPVMVDRSQIPPFDATAQTAFLATTANAGETFVAWMQRAILPYLLSAYGLTGIVS